MDMKQHFAAIRDAILAAEKDGFHVEIVVDDSSGFSNAELLIGSDGADWDDYSQLMKIMEAGDE